MPSWLVVALICSCLGRLAAITVVLLMR